MAKVKPIPDGFHSVTPHIVCRNASKAIEFYKQAFGAEERMRMPGPNGSVMHAELQIGDSTVMLGDENLDCGNTSPFALNGSPVTLHLYVTDADATFERAVKAGAKVRMPLADMFWGDRFGQVVDPFGHFWSIATHVKDLTPAEMGKAAAEAMANMPKGGKSAPASNPSSAAAKDADVRTKKK